jgi:hypothetical protein
VLKGGTVIPAGRDAFTIIRSLPHGHVAAAVGIARKIGLEGILGPDGNRCRDLVLAMLIGRILALSCGTPSVVTGSLGTARGVAASVGTVVMVLRLRAAPVLVRLVLGLAAAVTDIAAPERADPAR